MSESKQQNQREQLIDQIRQFPKLPGCYLMKNASGKVIYVGKAKNLNSRVRSYFNQSKSDSIKKEFLVKNIADIEIIIAGSEAEALILENNLIKKYYPRYNIQLKDDKTYPYLQVNYNDNFPRLEFIRRPKKRKKVKLIGPFPSGYNFRECIHILTKLFSLRDCSKSEFNLRKNPCVLYQMKQCSAPCVDYIEKELYEKDLNLAVSFFTSSQGGKKILSDVEKKMQWAAKNEEFELAALYRDYYFSLEEFYKRRTDQSVELKSKNSDVDIISYFKGEKEIDFVVYQMREGILIGQRSYYFLNSPLWDEDENLMITDFITSFYQNFSFEVPKILGMNMESKAAKDLEESLGTLQEQLNSSFRIQVGGELKSLIQTCTTMAQENQRMRIENRGSIYTGLNQLKSILSLDDMPRSIECYDIAIWQGKSPTAGQVFSYDGKLDKTRYRYYHLQELKEGNNDFAMMAEVFSRRLKSDLPLPDVVLIDGGKAQLNVFKKILEENKIALPILSIAKEKHRFSKHVEERLFIVNQQNSIDLKKYPILFKILTQLRDEAHRFSRKLHHKAEKKRVFKSFLDEIKGIPAKELIKIKSKLDLPLEHLKKLNENDLIDRYKIKKNHALILLEYLHDFKKQD